MKKKKLIHLLAGLFTLALLTPHHAHSQTTAAASVSRLEGIWQGTLTAPAGKLRLVLKVIHNAQNALTATLVSVDQGGAEIPVATTELKDNTVNLSLPAIAGKYEGKISTDGNDITGTWSQGPGSLPLDFKRDANVPAAPVANRPQEPKAPLPYSEEQVEFDSAPGVKLAGTLTLPQGAGPFPAVVLITGSGPQDRNEAIAGHKPFLVLADALTRRGIAVLRTDDRGIGKSTGNFAAGTSDDFATDALAGVQFLATRKDIAQQHIGLIGHSEGGLVAPLAVTRNSPAARQVAFIVLWAGPGVPLRDILIEQNRYSLTSNGATADVISRNGAIMQRLLDIATNDADVAHAAEAMRAIIREQIPATVPESLRAQMQTQIDTQVQQLNSPWGRWMLHYDPAPVLKQVKVPVLALFGGVDRQVPPAQNKEPMTAALAGNSKAKVVELPNLNHLFQTSTTGAPKEYAQIEETISPTALKTIGDWVVATTRN